MKDPKITKAVGINKDGYCSGGVDIEIPSQNLAIDPRGKSSFRGRGVYVAQGDNVEVKGTKRMLASKSKKATWY
jgi:hypothetical protein